MNARGGIEALVSFFLAKYSNLFGKYFRHLDPAVSAALYAYNWPGNIRELENSIEFMINMMDDDGHLSSNLLPKSLAGSPVEAAPATGSIRPLQELESDAIRAALALCGTTTRGKKLAAQQLGIGIATLYRKLQNLDLSK